MPEVSLSGINFTIKGTTDSASDSVNKLIGKLNELNKALSEAGNVKTVYRSLGSLKKSLDGLSGADSKGASRALKNISKAMESFKGVGDVSKNLASFARGMTKLAENKDDRLSALASWLAKIATIDFSNLEKAGQGIKQIADAANQLAKGTGGTGGTGKGKSFLDVLKSDLAKFGKVLLKSGKFLTAGFLSPLRRGVGNVKEFAGGLTKAVGGFKRIVGYRIIRSIIKEITQGFMEGTNNLYAWSTLVGGTFAKNMDDAATSMLYFKNSIGAAWSPLMNILAPALRAVTDAAVDLLNVINQLLARLTGQSSWTRAKRVATQYGDAVSDAGQAAKEALRYLAPFDELNVLPDQKDRGGGSGAADNASEMFEEVATFSEGIADFADKVKAAIQSSNWTGLGILLGEKVNEVVDSLDWSGAGTKVGKGINAWFTTKYWTLETINFQNIGSKIAEFLNNAVSNIDFNIIGRSLTQQFTNFGDLVIGAVSNINWNSVGNSIRDFIVGAFNQMSQWAQGIDWSEFGTTLYNNFKDFIEGIDFASIATSFFNFFGTALGAAVSHLSSIISGVVQDIKDYFLQYITDENGDGHFGAGEIISGIFEGIKNAVKNIGAWIKTNIFDPFVSGFKKTFGISTSNSAEMNDPGKKVGEGILDGLLQPFKNIGAWIKEHIFDPIKEKLSGFSISDLLFGGDGTGTGGTSEETNIDIKATLTKVGDWSQDVLDVVREKGGSVVKTVQAALNKASTWVQEAANVLKQPNAITKTVSTALDKAKTWVADAWTALSTKDGSTATKTIMAAVSKAKTWVAEAASALGITNGSSATKTISAAVDKAKTWVADAWTALTTKDGSQATKTVTSAVTKGSWNSQAYDVANMTDSWIDKKVDSSVYQYNWDDAAYYIATLGNETVTRTLEENVVAGSWNQDAFNGAKIKGGTVKKTLKLSVSGKIGKNAAKAINLGNSASTKTIETRVDVRNGFLQKGAMTALNARDKTVTVTVNAQGSTDGPLPGQGDALGGAYYNNKWHSIPQAAKGGRFHGTYFWAGEAGPEIVGHIGGRTEVLNQSQLASTMYAAVSRAMAGAQIRISGMNAPVSSDGGYDEEAMYRAMLRALNDSDVADSEITLDGDVLYRKMVQRNQMNTRMTGRNVMATA